MTMVIEEAWSVATDSGADHAFLGTNAKLLQSRRVATSHESGLIYTFGHNIDFHQSLLLLPRIQALMRQSCGIDATDLAGSECLVSDFVFGCEYQMNDGSFLIRFEVYIEITDLLGTINLI